MKLTLLKHEIEGPWDDEYLQYKCPCGKGTVVEYRDKEPGFKSHTEYILCEDCKDKYELIRDKAGYAREAKEIKNGR